MDSLNTQADEYGDDELYHETQHTISDCKAESAVLLQYRKYAFSQGHAILPNYHSLPPFVLGFLFNSIAVTWVSSLSLEMKKADPIGFSVLRDTNKIGRSNKFVLKTL